MDKDKAQRTKIQLKQSSSMDALYKMHTFDSFSEGCRDGNAAELLPTRDLHVCGAQFFTEILTLCNKAFSIDFLSLLK